MGSKVLNIYNQIFDQFQRYSTVKSVIDGLSGNESLTVLEVGANAHFNLAEYLPNANITFSDINEPVEKGHYSFVQADASNLPFDDDEFDFVICLDVLEHIPEHLRAEVISECTRVAQKAFIMCCPIDNDGFTNKAERRVSQIFKKFHGVEHPWLREHFEEGIPSVESINDTLRSLSKPYQHFKAGQLDWWECMMNIHMLETADERFRSVCESVYNHYNRYLNNVDFSEACYRGFWVVGESIKNLKLEHPKPSQNDKSCMLLLNELTHQLISLTEENRHLGAVSNEKDFNMKELVESNQFFRRHNDALLEKINSLEAQLEETKRKYDDILNSNSWLVMAPIRLFNSFLKCSLRRLKNAFNKKARILDLCCKSYGVYKDRGVKGLIKKIYHFILNKNERQEQNIEAGCYQNWLISRNEVELKDEEMVVSSISGRPAPLISILLPTYNSDIKFLRQCIDSVINQSYENWELCIADDASTNAGVRDVISSYAEKDNRIKYVFREENGHISNSSNSAIKLASGEWVALLDHDDLLHPHALSYVVKEIIHNPSVQFIYTDEDKIDVNGLRLDPHFKSDWNLDLLYSQNYVSHLGVYKTDLVKKIGGFREGYEGSQDYDLLLRYSREIDDKNVVHIPKVLYHWRAIDGSTALSSGEKSYTTQSGIKSLKDHFDNLDMDVVVEKGKLDNTYRVIYPLIDETGKKPLVSLIVPTYNGKDITKQAIESILELTDYENYEIILVDNNSDDPQSLEYFSSLEKHEKITVLRYPHPFNYSAINNFAVKYAKGEIIGLINNDIEVINSGWLGEMVSHAIRKEIGCVGAMLYYANDTIQHAGVILGIGGVAGHSHKYFPKGSNGYFSRLKLVQNLSAVTAACLIVRKEIYSEVAGLNEKDLTVAFNDVDFCLKVGEAGYRNLWTPYAELYHHESISRGTEDNPEKVKRFNKEVKYMKDTWGEVLKKDKFYNKNLSKVHENFSLI